MTRAIPPRTMSDLSRGRPRGSRRQESVARSARGINPRDRGIAVTPFRKPREWRYQTRPIFKRVLGPLVDVFSEAEEVLIVVDLGGFTRGEIAISMTPQQYVLRAARGDQRFEQIIDLPENADVEHAGERLLNGVLEIVLPRKKAVAVSPIVRRSRARRTGS